MLLFLVGAAFSALACSIPVFRYALDRWPADKFRLEISADDAKDADIGRFIRNYGAASALNLQIARATDSPSRLLRPESDGIDTAPIWSGALTTGVLNRLTNSPTRAEIVRRLLSGDSAVWVVVEPSKGGGSAALDSIGKRLRYLEQVAQMPVIDPTDPTSKLGPGPALQVKFSALAVSASDVSEKEFLTMLAGPDSGLADRTEPWLAVVFGRGRVLGAWPAVGFGDAQVEEVCLFLLGACSCQVKNLNPGWDVLLRVDWDEELRAIGFQAKPEQTFRSNTPPMPGGEPETVTISGGDRAAPEPMRRDLALAVSGATLLLLIAGGVAWRSLV